MGSIPGRIILTDDPLRARVLVAHHLEHATALHTREDFSLSSGSYNGVPIAVVSTGFGSDSVVSALSELKNLGATEISEVVYISACVSTTEMFDAGAVILADGGSKDLIDRALTAAGQIGAAATIATVFSPEEARPDEGCLIDAVTEVLCEQGHLSGFDVLSILTVSENSVTGGSLEENVVRSRLYPASLLVFEMFALS